MLVQNTAYAPDMNGILTTLTKVSDGLSHVAWQDWAWIVAVAHAVVTLYLLGRILANQKNTGVAVAWLMLLFALPVVGIFAYLLVGEPYLGKRYQARNAKTNQLIKKMLVQSDVNFTAISSQVSEKYRGVANIGLSATGFGVYDGHHTRLLTTSDDIFDALLSDIDQACVSILLEFYIIFPKGRVVQVFEAILAAQQRGVHCQILADSVGSFNFFSDDWFETLTQAGVSIHQSLPVGLFKTLFKRTDLRNHRKIVVIDDKVGYTGSFNLVDPKFFKQHKAVGEWIDVFMRIESTHRPSVVSALATVCLTDISAENKQNLQDFIGRADELINYYTRKLYRPEPAISDTNDLASRLPRLLRRAQYNANAAHDESDHNSSTHGASKQLADNRVGWKKWHKSLSNLFAKKQSHTMAMTPAKVMNKSLQGVTMQLIPSAPQITDHVIYDTLLTIMHRADTRIQITTPYFVPDEALLGALTTAAKRGVEVTLIVPKKVDSFLVQHASQASYQTLLEVGVRIACFTGGLLHTKTVVIDDDYALFGTVNMDLRSFYLNMELSLAIHTPQAVAQILECQQRYLAHCEWLSLPTWQQRSAAQNLFDATIRLFSPLL